MRYESFYPFTHYPVQPMRQQGFGQQNTFIPPSHPTYQQSSAGQQLESLTHHIPGEQGGQGPSKFENYMQTADRVLSTAQQFAPLIQQFAPMVSNLPSMWRLYKGFQSMPDRAPATGNNRTQTTSTQNSSEQRNATQGFSSTERRPSTPRIFQPPTP